MPASRRFSFADVAHIALTAFTDPSRPQAHRWWPRLAWGEGFVDYARLADGLEAEEAWLQTSGVAVDGPHPGRRIRPNGQRVAWRTLGLHHGSPTPLPFLIEDLTPRGLRVPDGAATGHPLGVDRVAGLIVLVGDLARSAPARTTLRHTHGIDHKPELGGTRAAKRFGLRSQWIELAEPDPAAAELRHHLQGRGPGLTRSCSPASGRRGGWPDCCWSGQRTARGRRSRRTQAPSPAPHDRK